MQQRIHDLVEKLLVEELLAEKLPLQGAQHPRNLDPPLPACYLPAEAFSSFGID
jgi:hypothetical protein